MEDSWDESTYYNKQMLDQAISQMEAKRYKMKSLKKKMKRLEWQMMGLEEQVRVAKRPRQDDGSENFENQEENLIHVDAECPEVIKAMRNKNRIIEKLEKKLLHFDQQSRSPKDRDVYKIIRTYRDNMNLGFSDDVDEDINMPEVQIEVRDTVRVEDDDFFSALASLKTGLGPMSTRQKIWIEGDDGESLVFWNCDGFPKDLTVKFVVKTEGHHGDRRPVFAKIADVPYMTITRMAHDLRDNFINALATWGKDKGEFSTWVKLLLHTTDICAREFVSNWIGDAWTVGFFACSTCKSREFFCIRAARDGTRTLWVLPLLLENGELRWVTDWSTDSQPNGRRFHKTRIQAHTKDYLRRKNEKLRDEGGLDRQHEANKTKHSIKL